MVRDTVGQVPYMMITKKNAFFYSHKTCTSPLGLAAEKQIQWMQARWNYIPDNYNMEQAI